MHDIIHIPYLEPCGAVIAHVEIGELTFSVLGMHLDISDLWRRKQAAANVKTAKDHGGDLPTILMGDLNEWRSAGWCLRDISDSYQLAPCGRSFHARRPVAQLDRIIYCDRLRLLDCGVLNSAASRKASDHLPVWATMEIV